jgi:WhiB family redox-sensing transcriptional regulator
VWTPAKSLRWQKDAECAKPENKHYIDWFFSKEFEKKYQAKNLCFSCPVRSECLQWALEHRQIWGVWGGKDEVELRRALSVSHEGEETKRRRPPHCPFCTAWPNKLEVSVEKLPGGGRWTTAKVVTCTECGFAWKSRTSANAVEAYKASKTEKKKPKTNPSLPKEGQTEQ